MIAHIAITASYDRLMHPTGRQLEAFLAVMRLQSVTQAARELGYSQPALSKALAALERCLDARLFNREAKVLIPTGRALALVSRAEEAVESIRRLRDDGPCSALWGELLVGGSTSIANSILPAILGAFGTRHPELTFKVSVGNYRSVVRGLEERRIDLGLVASACDHPEMESSPWGTDELVIVCLPSHRLASLSACSPEELASQAWISRESGSGTRSVFDAAMAKAGIKPFIKYEFGSNEAARRGILAGLGIGCLSILAVKADLELGNLCALPCALLELRRPCSFVTLRRRAHAPSLMAFRDFLANDFPSVQSQARLVIG
jgi:DNA-binding transcriptional LysR family regulator